MINYVYLITNGNGFYKVGFTKDLNRRMVEYERYNPSNKLVSYANTYGKTKMALETALHREIKNLGFDFAIDSYEEETEWFYPSNTLKNAMNKHGLSVFKACNNRQVWVLFE